MQVNVTLTYKIEAPSHIEAIQKAASGQVAPSGITSREVILAKPTQPLKPNV